MARSSYLFTSESVSEGHPDKVCDRISDEIVDASTAMGRAGLGSEGHPRRLRDPGHHQPRRHRRRSPRPRGPDAATTIDPAGPARRASDIGYEQDGFHWENAKIDVLLHAQSADIAQGVDSRRQQGRGRRRPGHHVRLCLPRDAGADAGADLLRPQDPASCWPRPATPASSAELGPDAKSQVTVRYENGKPVGATQIVVSTQHLDESLTSQRRARRSSSPMSARRCPKAGSRRDTIWHVNPTGKFVIGGPDGDCRPHRPQDHRRHLRRRGARMAAAPSPARTRPRSTARPPMRRATSPRTSSRPASPTAAPSSSPTPSASPSRCRSMSTCTAPARSTRPSSRTR